MRGGWNPPLIGGWSGGSPPRIFLKIYVSENVFQAILKPFFPYSITSILSKVRHSNTRGGGEGGGGEGGYSDIFIRT